MTGGGAVDSEHVSELPRAAEGTALLLDAAGTLLRPAEPVARTYVRFARRFGGIPDEREVSSALRGVMQQARDLRRGDPDWRAYWAEVIRRSTGLDTAELLDALYRHFSTAEAWRVAEGASACCRAVRARGMKVAIVSNWDRRLRPLLVRLGIDWVDEVVVSAELGVEKPQLAMFRGACARLGVEPGNAVHVGDSPDDDVAGARAAGCHALLFGGPLCSFAELQRLLVDA